jgi:hypothetical protein
MQTTVTEVRSLVVASGGKQVQGLALPYRYPSSECVLLILRLLGLGFLLRPFLSSQVRLFGALFCALSLSLSLPPRSMALRARSSRAYLAFWRRRSFAVYFAGP